MTTTLAASALAVMATHDAFARQADAAGTDPLKPQNSDAPAQVLTCDVVVADAMSPAIGKMMTSGIGPPCGAVGRSGPR
ncbi:hypothetical protein [Paracoccus salsus]|uniref:hypothetical protein n=1 Tax=Paracoccus salsus TaxID=2911061 RepID=UPI001F482F17|nr:hypothetical protein [Paracoccus salsus]MCF3972811.1 hypothetical protein [Paracoccus salsus]